MFPSSMSRVPELRSRACEAECGESLNPALEGSGRAGLAQATGQQTFCSSQPMRLWG